MVDYDNETKLPICNTSSILKNIKRPPECPVRHLVLIPSKSIQTQHVQIQRIYSLNCTAECNTKLNIVLHNLGQDYCVQRPLINDLLPFDNYRNSNSMFTNLAALTFFCQTMKDIQSCHRLANLCTLSKYASDKLSPCSIFHANSQQTTMVTTTPIDDKTYFDQLRPKLFYKQGKESIEILDGILRQSYDTEENGEVSTPGLIFYIWEIKTVEIVSN